MHKSQMTARCGCVFFRAWETTSFRGPVDLPFVLESLATSSQSSQPTPSHFRQSSVTGAATLRDAGPMHGGEGTDSCHEYHFLLVFFHYTISCAK